MRNGVLSAAIACFGQNGATLLPFRKGDRVVVDLSIPSVRAGRSDPREIEKLLHRGAEVFSRANLHAKVIVTDREALVGSANASGRAVNLLDEAALLSSDPAVVRRAREFVDSLCNEPIRPEYLALCKREYRPPRFGNSARPGPARAAQRIRPAKLWIVGLGDRKMPTVDEKRFAQGEQQAKAMIHGHHKSAISSFWWPTKPAFAALLRPGDWVIYAMRYSDGGSDVSAPGQFLFLDICPRERGKHLYVFYVEVPQQAGTVAWTQFRRVAQKIGSVVLPARPRTRAIHSLAAADALLRLWTVSGRPSKLLQRR